MYSIANYGHMIADKVRMDAYERALRKAVKPGAVVLDIGTGTGIFALLACRLGARKVYAVEPSDAVHVAREIASANGYAGTVEFIQALSTEVRLPVHADVIVSDLRGVLPLHQRHLTAIADARRRLLAPGGILIPQRDTLWLACFEAPDLYREIETPWSDNAYGLDMQAARQFVSDSWLKVHLPPARQLTAPQCCGTIDYLTVENPDFVADATLQPTRAGTAHGFCVWFDATLAEGIQFSNAPGETELIYGKAFFRWPKPVALDVGDTISISLRASLIGDDYVWRWDSRILGQGDPHQVRTQFKQSTFFGALVSPATIHKHAASYFPVLSNDGLIDRTILQMMGDGIRLGDIARHLVSQYPDRFARWQDALARVGELSMRYTK